MSSRHKYSSDAVVYTIDSPWFIYKHLYTEFRPVSVQIWCTIVALGDHRQLQYFFPTFLIQQRQDVSDNRRRISRLIGFLDTAPRKFLDHKYTNFVFSHCVILVARREFVSIHLFALTLYVIACNVNIENYYIKRQQHTKDYIEWQPYIWSKIGFDIMKILRVKTKPAIKHVRVCSQNLTKYQVCVVLKCNPLSAVCSPKSYGWLFPKSVLFIYFKRRFFSVLQTTVFKAPTHAQTLIPLSKITRNILSKNFKLSL